VPPLAGGSSARLEELAAEAAAAEADEDGCADEGQQPASEAEQRRGSGAVFHSAAAALGSTAKQPTGQHALMPGMGPSSVLAGLCSTPNEAPSTHWLLPGRRSGGSDDGEALAYRAMHALLPGEGSPRHPPGSAAGRESHGSGPPGHQSQRKLQRSQNEPGGTEGSKSARSAGRSSQPQLGTPQPSQQPPQPPQQQQPGHTRQSAGAQVSVKESPRAQQGGRGATHAAKAARALAQQLTKNLPTPGACPVETCPSS
jgi:hypothetical protein